MHVFPLCLLLLWSGCAFAQAAVRPELLLHVPFDGTADAKSARGAATLVCTQSLTFAEGVRGQAVRLTATAKSMLDHAMASNAVPERGAFSLWFRREGPLDDNPDVRWNGMVLDDWNHLAVVWDASGVKIHLNGRFARDEGARPSDAPTLLRRTLDAFCAGGSGDRGAFEGLIDDLRLYSAPLSEAQIRELHRRACVIEITATGLYALADTQGTIVAQATSPAGCPLKGLHYCLCDRNGSVVTAWKDAVSKKSVSLLVNLPAGRYALRVTDGTWFYGGVPFMVLRRDNPYIRDANDSGPSTTEALTPAVMHEPADPKPPAGAKRFWRDLHAGAFSQSPVATNAPRRSVVRFCTDAPSDVHDKGRFSVAELDDRIDRTIAQMKCAGENALAYPCAGRRAPVCLDAWYAKFDHAGLGLYPILLPETNVAPTRVSGILASFAEQGTPHASFRGVCLATSHPEEWADFCAAESRKLAARRADLKLWVRAREVADNAVPSPRTLVQPLRDGDAAQLVREGRCADAMAPEDRCVPLFQAFRALPAITFLDVGAVVDDVRVRHGTWDGASWFYAVNVGPAPVKVLLEVPARTVDLATGARVGGLMGTETLTFDLQPGAMRSYRAPEGRPLRR